MSIKSATISADLRPVLFTLQRLILDAQRAQNLQAPVNDAGFIQRITDEMTIFSSKHESSQEIEQAAYSSLFKINQREPIRVNKDIITPKRNGHETK